MITSPKITPEIVKSHGLTEEEYQKIVEILGREPNITELGIFSVMWSEHCSYKNSRKVLQLFPREGDALPGSRPVEPEMVGRRAYRFHDRPSDPDEPPDRGDAERRAPLPSVRACA